MSIMSGYRLIWFQHFHKCAGTSVIALARLNGERFYPKHWNGNPLDGDGFMLPLWDYSAEQIKTFLDQCEKDGVTFVATEFGCPDYSFISPDKRVVSITVLRDPKKRIISNYEYDVTLGVIPRRPLSQYIRMSHLPHAQPNYYTNLLSMNRGGMGSNKKAIIALHNLQQIDYRYSMRDPEFLRSLAATLGWKHTHIRANKTGNVAARMYQALRMRSFDKLVRLIWLEHIYARKDYARAIEEFQSKAVLDACIFESI